MGSVLRLHSRKWFSLPLQLMFVTVKGQTPPVNQFRTVRAPLWHIKSLKSRLVSITLYDITITRESELMTNDTSIKIVKVFITNGAPCLINADFHSPVASEVAVVFT